MATTATPSPAAPASSAAPSSTPSSTPSTPATPSTPSTPVTPASPVETTTSVSTPAEAPAATETTAPPATTAKPQPKQDDFPGDPEAFLNALHEWERENPDSALVDTVAAEEPAKQEEAKAEEPKKETDPEEKPWAAEPDKFTPEVVNGWADKNPLLKQVWEQSPELKNQMFAMARQNAALAPMGEIFPDVEAAQFANEKSSRYVDLREAFTAAEDNPEAIGGAYDALSQEFMVRDEKGEPVLDKEGNPTFTADFNHLNEHIGKSFLEHHAEVAEQLIAASGGTNEEAQLAAQAAKFLGEWIDKRGKPEDIDTSGLTPELKAWHDKQKAAIDAEREKLGLQSKEQTAAQKQQAVDNFHNTVSRKTGGMVGKRIDTYLAEKEANGIFIPSYALDAREPGMKISSFAKTVLDQFNDKCGSISHVKQQIAALRRLPPSAENEQRRLDYNAKLVDQFLPPIIDSEVRKIQNKEISDRQRRQKGQQKREEMATVEPQGGSARQPQTMTDADIYNKAKANVAKSNPEAEGRELLELVLQERNRLSSGR